MKSFPLVIFCRVFLLGLGSMAWAGTADGEETAVHKATPLVRVTGLHSLPVGMSSAGETIPGFLPDEQLSPGTNDGKMRVLLISGIDGTAVAEPVKSAAIWFHTAKAATRLRESFQLSVVPDANVLRNRIWGLGKPLFPPPAGSYQHETHQAAQYLWRWIGTQGFDLVIVVRSVSNAETAPAWTGVDINGILKSSTTQRTGRQQADWQRYREWLSRLSGVEKTDGHDAGPGSLPYALATAKPANVGTIPAAVVAVNGDKSDAQFLNDALTALAKKDDRWTSAARRELQTRVARTPLQVAEQLAKVYGHDLRDVQYIPAVAVIGRLSLSDFTGEKDQTAVLRDVERIVQPFREGTKPALGKRVSGSHLSGHLVFAELAPRTGDAKSRRRYVELVQAAADLGFQTKDGTPPTHMPFHNEMSDAVFMACPLLVSAGQLTSDPKYTQLALKHLAFMQELCLREDGLYRHSPLNAAAWGRGNGFPALGLALCLSELPENDPAIKVMLPALQKHLRALLLHQDATGMWHQVIDHPESYRELTATSMITFAMIRGVRNGWLPAQEFQPHIDKAIHALKARISADGQLVDVCTGTGKQKTLHDYFKRTAILGRDARGGAMALLVMTEAARQK